MPIPELLRLPWREFVIESPLARELAIRELRKAVGPRRFFGISKIEQPFEGEVGADDFRVFRTIRYRNSFLPLILGKFENAPSGSRASVTMRPIWLVLGVWILWMSFALVAAAATMALVFKGRSPGIGGIAIGLGLPVFGYLLASVSVAIEARKARRMLTEILTGRGAAAESAAMRR